MNPVIQATIALTFACLAGVGLGYWLGHGAGSHSSDLCRETAQRFVSVMHGIGEVRDRMRPERPPAPAPFVCVLVEATSDKGPTTMGACGRAGEAIELRAMVPLRDARVIVFCDVEQVDVRVFVGTDLAHAMLGPAPMAYVPELHPGQRIAVATQAIGNVARLPS